jgi:hypothetical protein
MPIKSRRIITTRVGVISMCDCLLLNLPLSLHLDLIATTLDETQSEASKTCRLLSEASLTLSIALMSPSKDVKDAKANQRLSVYLKSCL